MFNSLRHGLALLLAFATPTLAEDDSDLAKKLSNPVSSLISVPFQLNYNSGYGTLDGNQTLLNIQPVIPVSISSDWNMISRTIMPVISQTAFVPGQEDVSGFGDITQSLFYSPKAPTKGGLIWGIGPAFLLPTASDESLGTGKFGIGPTAVALVQKNGFTVGALANHIWSVAGDEDRADVNATYLQPFLSYTTKKATSFTINTESTYDWETEQWSVPINLTVGQIVKLGGKPVQITAGARYWAQSPEGGAEGWGGRFVVTYLFPKG